MGEFKVVVKMEDLLVPVLLESASSLYKAEELAFAQIQEEARGYFEVKEATYVETNADEYIIRVTLEDMVFELEAEDGDSADEIAVAAIEEESRSIFYIEETSVSAVTI